MFQFGSDLPIDRRGRSRQREVTILFLPFLTILPQETRGPNDPTPSHTVRNLDQETSHLGHCRHRPFGGLYPARSSEFCRAGREPRGFACLSRWKLLGGKPAFIAAYVVIVAFSLPGATIATLTGGFLFGVFPGVLFNVLGATLGAGAVFLAARSGFGADMAAKMEQKGGAAARLQQGLRENEWSVLLMMRLVPAVPFFLANLIPAFVGTSLFRFVITTFFGIMPGALVFTSVGAGLGEVFARGETPDLSIIFAPHVLGPILGLAALSALPIILKKFKKGA